MCRSRDLKLLIQVMTELLEGLEGEPDLQDRVPAPDGCGPPMSLLCEATSGAG